MNRRFCLTPVLLAASLLLTETYQATAQAPAAPKARDVQDMEAAGNFFNSGNYAEAAKLYNGIPTQYPNSDFIPEALVQLGYVQFLQGDYDKAVGTLEKVPAHKKSQPAQIEISAALIPQILTAKASKLKPEDPARKSSLETAVKKFDEFLQKFPNSTEVESATYYKALALNQLSRYEDAVTVLKANLQKFPKSPTILDSQYLLALTLATSATNKAQSAVAKDPSIDATYDEAERLLSDIIANRSDIALGNDARFQWGETLFARAGFLQDPAARKAMFEKALEMFRYVAPNEAVIQAQQARVEAFRGQKAEAARRADLEGIKRWDRIINKELEKLGALKERPDQTVSAKLKAAQIYFQLGKFDECRVVLNFLKPFATDADQKKQVAYFTALSYAMQDIDPRTASNPQEATDADKKLTDKAVQAYTEFRSAYAKDPIGDNLALVVGARFLDTEPKQYEKAIEYFKESLADYPNGRFKIQSLNQEASALTGLKHYDEAVDIFKKTLAASPSKDVSAAAQFGLAVVYQQTGKIDEAIKEYKEVRDKYAGLPQAEQAAYLVGQLLYEKQDAKAAASELQTFTKNFPNSGMGSNALYYLGLSQLQAGQKAEGLASLKQIPDKYPKADVAPYSFFQRATVANNDQNYPEAMAILQGFIKSYPDSPELFKAYDFIAKALVVQNKVPEAIASYEEFVKARPQDPKAPNALLQISTLWKGLLEKMVNYIALNPDQRKEWDKYMTSSLTASEKVVNDFPDSQEVALALTTILDCQKRRQRAGLIDDAGIEKYFRDLAAKFDAKPATRSKVIFTLASFTYDKDKQKAAEQMASAYNAGLQYAPEDLDKYGEALIAAKKLDEAEKIYTKLAADYPVPANTDPANVSREIGDAQAMALFGLGKILQEKGKVADAGEKFETLKKLYPWSKKMQAANYGIALRKFEDKSYDEASKLLIGIAGSSTAPSDLRANAIMLLAKINEAEGDYEAAINNYIKIDAAFGNGAPSLSADGLWSGAQLLEREGRGELPMPSNKPKGTPAPKAHAAAATPAPAASSPGKAAPAKGTPPPKAPATKAKPTPVKQ